VAEALYRIVAYSRGLPQSGSVVPHLSQPGHSRNQGPGLGAIDLDDFEDSHCFAQVAKFGEALLYCPSGTTARVKAAQPPVPPLLGGRYGTVPDGVTCEITDTILTGHLMSEPLLKGH